MIDGVTGKLEILNNQENINIQAGEFRVISNADGVVIRNQYTEFKYDQKTGNINIKDIAANRDIPITVSGQPGSWISVLLQWEFMLRTEMARQTDPAIKSALEKVVARLNHILDLRYKTADDVRVVEGNNERLLTFYKYANLLRERIRFFGSGTFVLRTWNPDTNTISQQSGAYGPETPTAAGSQLYAKILEELAEDLGALLKNPDYASEEQLQAFFEKMMKQLQIENSVISTVINGQEVISQIIKVSVASGRLQIDYYHYKTFRSGSVVLNFIDELELDTNLTNRVYYDVFGWPTAYERYDRSKIPSGLDGSLWKNPLERYDIRYQVVNGKRVVHSVIGKDADNKYTTGQYFNQDASGRLLVDYTDFTGSPLVWRIVNDVKTGKPSLIELFDARDQIDPVTGQIKQGSQWKNPIDFIEYPTGGYSREIAMAGGLGTVYVHMTNEADNDEPAGVVDYVDMIAYGSAGVKGSPYIVRVSSGANEKSVRAAIFDSRKIRTSYALPGGLFEEYFKDEGGNSISTLPKRNQVDSYYDSRAAFSLPLSQKSISRIADVARDIVWKAPGVTGDDVRKAAQGLIPQTGHEPGDLVANYHVTIREAFKKAGLSFDETPGAFGNAEKVAEWIDAFNTQSGGARLAESARVAPIVERIRVADVASFLREESVGRQPLSTRLEPAMLQMLRERLAVREEDARQLRERGASSVFTRGATNTSVDAALPVDGAQSFASGISAVLPSSGGMRKIALQVLSGISRVFSARLAQGIVTLTLLGTTDAIAYQGAVVPAVKAVPAQAVTDTLRGLSPADVRLAVHQDFLGYQAGLTAYQGPMAFMLDGKAIMKAEEPELVVASFAAAAGVNRRDGNPNIRVAVDVSGLDEVAQSRLAALASKYKLSTSLGQVNGPIAYVTDPELAKSHTLLPNEFLAPTQEFGGLDGVALFARFIAAYNDVAGVVAGVIQNGTIDRAGLEKASVPSVLLQSLRSSVMDPSSVTGSRLASVWNGTADAFTIGQLAFRLPTIQAVLNAALSGMRSLIASVAAAA